MKRITIEVYSEEDNDRIYDYVDEWVKLNFQDYSNAIVKVEDI
jgi:hypothetical protein